MSAYLIGNLLGRFIVSYAVVWVVIWLAFSQRQWRQAFRNTHRWYGLLSVMVIFLIGVFTATAKGSLL